MNDIIDLIGCLAGFMVVFLFAFLYLILLAWCSGTKNNSKLCKMTKEEQKSYFMGQLTGRGTPGDPSYDSGWPIR